MTSILQIYVVILGVRSLRNSNKNTGDLLVDVFSDKARFNALKARLEFEHECSKIEHRIHLAIETAAKSVLNDLSLLINERRDAIEKEWRKLIWGICESRLQLLESGFQDDNSSLKFEESEQDSGDRVAAKRAIISDTLEYLGLDEARVLELLGDIDVVEGRAGETVWDVHCDASSSVGCGDTSTVGDGRGEGGGLSGSSSPSSRGGGDTVA